MEAVAIVHHIQHCYQTLHHITTVTVARISSDTQWYFDYFNKSLVHTTHSNELISHNTSQMQFPFFNSLPKTKELFHFTIKLELEYMQTLKNDLALKLFSVQVLPVLHSHCFCWECQIQGSNCASYAKEKRNWWQETA